MTTETLALLTTVLATPLAVYVAVRIGFHYHEKRWDRKRDR